MPPRPVNKINWMLVLAVGSMVITLTTIICSGAWIAAQKSTNLDMVSANIVRNTADINSANLAITDLKLDIKGLKDQNDRLLDEVNELKLELQAKQSK